MDKFKTFFIPNIWYYILYAIIFIMMYFIPNVHSNLGLVYFTISSCVLFDHWSEIWQEKFVIKIFEKLGLKSNLDFSFWEIIFSACMNVCLILLAIYGLPNLLTCVYSKLGIKESIDNGVLLGLVIIVLILYARTAFQPTLKNKREKLNKLTINKLEGLLSNEGKQYLQTEHEKQINLSFKDWINKADNLTEEQKKLIKRVKVYRYLKVNVEFIFLTIGTWLFITLFNFYSICKIISIQIK